ncbi:MULTISPECIES: polysaccharide pyruvyl transferase family protein [Bacteroides]|uniref:polysaccharide pyruvyl transferase family protein n=1 Tax=Bacteroides TaxID=816 RepID=UPI00319DDFEA
MKIYLPIHIDVNNRGCEAITKATAKLLNMPKEDIIALSRNVVDDKKNKVDKYVTLVQSKMKLNLWTKIQIRFARIFCLDPFVSIKLEASYNFDDFLKKIRKEDIVLSTGGDMLCYGDNSIIYINEYLYKRGIKTILWGCSIGEKNLTPRKLKTLEHFSLIYVRESLTKKVLEQQGLKNIVFYPDPAFILTPTVCTLPECFTGNKVIGINLSNFVSSSYSLNSVYGRNIKNLIDYILENTNYKMLLIPHVLWKGQDDREISKLVSQMYENESRISTLDSVMYDYCQIRYIISNCEMFIGARTHSIISAYSTCVPALALGYSIKSEGIAKDLGLSQKLVVNCVNFNTDTDILDSFIYMEKNRIAIKEHLDSVIPQYKNSRINLSEYL